MDLHFDRILEDLFQKTEEMIVVFDCLGKIKFMNNKASEVLQLSDSTSNVLQVAETSYNEWQHFITTIKKNGVVNSSVSVINKYNQDIKIEISGYYIEERQLVFARMQQNLQIVIQEEQKKNLNLFQQFMNSMMNGIVLSNLNGKVLSTNSIALQLLNRTSRQVENRSHDCLFEHVTCDSASILDYYKKLSNHELAIINVKKFEDAGKMYYLNFESKINESLGIVITTIVDHTEKFLLLEKVAHQQSLAILGQNVATIAHEIRNPLTSIKGFIQLMKNDRSQAELPYFQIVESELEKMNELLMDVLDFSKAKKAKFTYVNLRELLEYVIELMNPKAIHSNVAIVFEYEEDETFTLYGNKNRIQQLVINLLKNAIESVEQEGCIYVKLQYKSTDCMQLIVEDQGSGMSEHTMEDIFEPFYTTKDSGTGLGLQVIQSVVNEHNGLLQVESELGKGTKFTVEFELTKPLYVNTHQGLVVIADVDSYRNEVF